MCSAKISSRPGQASSLCASTPAMVRGSTSRRQVRQTMRSRTSAASLASSRLISTQASSGQRSSLQRLMVPFLGLLHHPLPWTIEKDKSSSLGDGTLKKRYQHLRATCAADDAIAPSPVK